MPIKHIVKLFQAWAGDVVEVGRREPIQIGQA
jgi:hypothetical protein